MQTLPQVKLLLRDAGWDMSTKLFHARFGGSLSRPELLNTRAGSSASGLYDEALLGNAWADPADTSVHSWGAAHFWTELSVHEASVQACMAAVKPV